jgi:low affinity Fe/Cu permease
MWVLHGMHASGRRADAGPTHCYDHFERLSMLTVKATGCRWGFRLALLLILAWAAAGPFFRYHESWTAAFTVATTSVTFLLVFLIQNAQNRELKAVHLKLDELIFSATRARNELIHIEHLTEGQLDLLGQRYSKLAAMYQNSLRKSVEEATPQSRVDQSPFENPAT